MGNWRRADGRQQARRGGGRPRQETQWRIEERRGAGSEDKLGEELGSGSGLGGEGEEREQPEEG